MSDTSLAARFIRFQVATYYDQSLPPDVLVPPEPPEAPVLDSIDPTSIIAGGSGDLVTVAGENFAAASKVWADEEEQATTYVSATTLTYLAQADQAGTQTITVRTGEMVSGAIELTIDAPAVQVAAADPENTQADAPPSPRRRRS